VYSLSVCALGVFRDNIPTVYKH